MYKEIHIEIKVTGEAPSDAELDASRTLQALIQRKSLGVIINTDPRVGIIDIFIETDDAERAVRELALLTVRRGVHNIVNIEVNDSIDFLSEKLEKTFTGNLVLERYGCETFMELFEDHFFEAFNHIEELEEGLEDEDFAALLIIAATIQPDDFFNLYAERPIEGIEDTGMESVIKNQEALQAALEVAKKRAPDSKIPESPETGMVAQVSEDAESLAIMKDLASTDDGGRILHAAVVSDINEIWDNPEKVRAAINIIDTFQWRIDSVYIKTFLLMVVESHPDVVIGFYEEFIYSGITDENIREVVVDALRKKGFTKIDPAIFVAEETT